MFSDQVERNFVMVKSFAMRIQAIMASHAICPECQEVFRGKRLINLQVAITARGLIKWRSKTFYMAILTGKRSTICLGLMGR